MLTTNPGGPGFESHQRRGRWVLCYWSKRKRLRLPFSEKEKKLQIWREVSQGNATDENCRKLRPILLY